ncbi:MAG: biosynthetic-type acetolactate synthase large subunit [Methanomassiliicoccaceae archaeon]|jgi:acetolactate synthase-1/2/3 large subunit|nr:biosynthetic-type acetolactate synthase large subunit [Methanomassiliicoccaceae archaeon]
MKGSRALLKMLEDKGVETMFGYPGGQVIPIFDEILNSSVRHVLVRHEQCAAHMADGYARASGRPGVCLATSGPGATNLVTGVATAFADSIPMIVLTGQVSTMVLGMGAFQEVDAFSLMMPVTKYNYRVLDLQMLPEAVSRGWEISLAGRQGPVHIDLPVDAINSDIDASLLNKKFDPVEVREDLSKLPYAIGLIRKAQRPLIIAGGGVISSNSSNELIQLAELIQAPVIMPLMGLGSIPYDHPLSMGSMGMHGKMSSLNAMKEADLVIAIGTRFSDRSHSMHNKMSQNCKVIQIDIDRVEFNKHAHTAVNILADAKGAMQEIISQLKQSTPCKEWVDRIKEVKKRCSCDNINDNTTPISPRRVMAEINKILDENTIITTDVGQNQMWAMHHLRIQRPRQLISSGGMGTMGFGFPAAIGAKIAKPDKKVIAIVGDGGLLMVVQELATAVAENVPVVICLMNNGWLGMVKQWQKLFWNERYSGTELQKSNPDFVKLAEAFGAKGIRVERPSELGKAFKEALASDRVCLVDILIDQDEAVLPMLPPNPTLPIIRGKCPF